MKFSHKKSVADLTSEPRGHRSFLKRIGRDPHADWFLSILVAFVVTVVLVVIGASKYLKFNSNLEKEISSTKTSNVSAIDTKLLESVFKRFEDKAVLRNELTKTYVGPSDPSI